MLFNEPKMNIIRCPKPLGAQERKMTVFRVKLPFSWRKSAAKFLRVNTVSNKVVRHSLAYLSMQYGSHGMSPTTWNLAETDQPPFKNSNFQSIFTRNASAVTLSKTCSVNTNRKSITCFLKSLRWTVYVALSPEPPKEAVGLKNPMSKIWTVICDNFAKARDRMSVKY